MKKKKILILNSHPRQDSLCDDIATEYRRGAEDGKHDVHFVTLRNLHFDPLMIQKHGEPKKETETSILTQQKLVKWCGHLVIITPQLSMAEPALLKGYMDRVFAPGFAYEYKGTWRCPFPKRFLKGRSVRIIYTQGGSCLATAIVGLDAFWHALKYGVFFFAGFFPISRTVLDNLTNRHNPARINRFLKKVYKLGKKGK